MNITPDLTKAKANYSKSPSILTAELYIEALEQRLDMLRARLRNEQASDAATMKLAHIGMALEIGGHELHSIDGDFRSAMSKLPDEIRKSPVGDKLRSSFEQLIGTFRGLSPMQASRQSQRWITGQEIADTLKSFKASDPVRFSEAFLNMRIFTWAADLLPAVANLVLNARQWVQKSSATPDILVDVVDGKIIVADNGPGVPEVDQDFIFDPLFSNRPSGTGVGLYLVKSRIKRMMGSVRYIDNDVEKLLPGANFELEIPGIET